MKELSRIIICAAVGGEMELIMPMSSQSVNNITANYNRTKYCCYLGYIVQAIVVNFSPLLFLTFSSTYNISLDKITLIITLNFVIQLIMDLIFAKYADKIGYKKCAIIAQAFAAAGLICLGILPNILSNAYAGILISVVLYATGGGIIEVIISPIIEACPFENKSASMSILHSFYCWGQVGVVLVSTIFFFVFGISNWYILAFLWALVPLINIFLFWSAPVKVLTEESEGMSIKSLLSKKIFWGFLILMLCAGASELAMSQWASVFAESGLGVSKAVGDLMGPCLFAIFMGISRVIYAKFSQRISLQKFMLASTVLCIASYLLAALSPWAVFSFAGCAMCGFSVGIMWPGAFSLSSEYFPSGGTAMFAMLALGGDLGCSFGPTLVGMISSANGSLHSGLLMAVAFPLLMIVCLFVIRRKAA